MSERLPAFYAHRGSTWSDIRTILHVPYTTWHLSHVAIGAGLAPDVDWTRLAGTLAAFAVGLGVGAHALDEVHDRPLGTTLGERTLWVLGIGGLLAALAIAVTGMYVISPWVLAWAVAGVLLCVAYALELSPIIHSDVGFALAWGAFPAVVGYWAQTESLGWPILFGAAAATVLSAVQRSLSNAAKKIRRNGEAAAMTPEDEERLRTWEVPLRLLSAAVPLVAAAILAMHV
ncbi:MAG: hypothetical protein GEU79_03640 [Acidimicrobiia bacterium]|nr:hypothetical protein [Acidimicrobiia bacterium]